ncbi:hypothetical protein PoB_006231100 [Plakobranchus ocellatus]|uniref:Uncharacterized protein n=1 Tax=Plakobranchus ocellatus TaxID=259542 RepID=A0AAV4CVT9_9GAST|nr:hypothetical protein PoB_006231100 [Plakobranchus ocellatus]
MVNYYSLVINDLATSASDAQGLHLRGPYRVDDQVLARRPKVLKVQSTWSKPLTILEVLGNWTYRLSDDQTWNAHKLRRYPEPEALLLYHHHPTLPLNTLSTPQPWGFSGTIFR